MKKELNFELQELSSMTKVPILEYKKNQEFLNHIIYNEPFLSRILEEVKKDIPNIYAEMEDIFYGILCISEDEYLLIGPVCVGKFDYGKRHDFLKIHNLKMNVDIEIVNMRLESFLHLLILINYLVFEKKFTLSELLQENHLTTSIGKIERESHDYWKKKQDEDIYHHTYMEEKKWTDCIRRGDVENVTYYMEKIHGTEGILSEKAVNHNRYLAVTTITLATRAAIEGGVNPAKAYEVSDIFIKRIDTCNKLTQINKISMEGSLEFTKMVRDIQKNKVYSGYIEQCKWYIHQNYQKKISLEKIAEFIGINATYLSHLFSEQENITMQEYLNQVRIDRAKNLLKYSESTLTEISDYVGFCSQSYFGKIFKKYMGITPNQYRNQKKMIKN